MMVASLSCRRISWLGLLAMLTCSSSVAAESPGDGPSPPSGRSAENLFANASFELGHDLWRMDLAGKTAGRFMVDNDDAGAGQQSALLSVGAVDEWGVQFGQSMDAEAPGKTCTFAVLARSVKGPVALRLEIERRGKPYDRAAASERFNVTRDAWTELHVTFQVDKPFPQGWFAYVSCNQPDSEFRLDMFRLYEGQYIAYREAARQEALSAGATLFDTGTSSAAPLPGKAIDARAGWVQVPEDTTDHQFRGDAVIANDHLAVVLRRGGPGAEVYSVGAHPAALRAVLSPADAPPGTTLASLAITENGLGEVIVEAGFDSPAGKTLGLRYALAMGQLFVRTEPSGSLPPAALNVEAPCRFVVLPDFFADDIVVDAAAMPVDTADLPSENFLLRLLPGGDAIVMSVTTSRDEDARIELSGPRNDRDRRLVTRSSLLFGQQGKIFVAVIEAPGIWHERDVVKADASQILPLDWSAPYPAQWRVDWSRSDRLTGSWEMISERSDGEFEKYDWANEPSTIPGNRSRWTTVLGTFSYPCWLDTAGRGYLQPLGRVVHFEGPALIYPIKRVRATLLDAFTVVDVVRATLGVGPCEYILDVEGQGSRYKGRATCSTRDSLAAIYGRHQQKQKRQEVEQILEEVVVFVKHIRGRIEDYVAFGHELLAYLDEQKKDRPELADLISELETLTRSIDEHVEARRAAIKTPAYVIDLTEKFRRTLLDYVGEDALEKCNAITHAIVDVGGNQDELVGECRMVVKALRQRAGLALAQEPRAAEIAQEIRSRSQQVLRNPAGHEGARH
jgi:hypothetical protein